jgi:hypothetical protein
MFAVFGDVKRTRENTMARNYIAPALALTLAASFAGCAAESEPSAPEDLDISASDFTKVLDNKGDASAEAIFLDFEFDGELFTKSSFRLETQIEEQLLYTIGHLNGDNSVGDLNRLELTDVESTSEGAGFKVTYRAKLIVAWGDKERPATEYTFTLPRDISNSGLEAFTDKYSHDCVDFGAHDVDTGSMWYYYRPERSRCSIADEDVVKLPVEVSVSDINTTGKYPEYDKVWEDDALRVVAVFGKYEDGATSNSDAGISAYNRFLREMSRELSALDSVETTPAEVPSSPGVDLPDVTWTATMGDQTVEVTALLVDNVRTAGFEFNQRYAELTPRADLIVYNGHAGLGSNIRAMARKGEWLPGQYSIVFMNGCDTYAYVDSALYDARAEINPDDPIGTKYVDVVTNAMPSFFREMSQSTMAIFGALLAGQDDPRTYEQIFVNIDDDEVVLVSGEQDNEFVPGGGSVDPIGRWDGMQKSGTVTAGEEHRFETPVLREGKVTFVLTGTDDADLYIRTGAEPTEATFDCRPFRAGSAEQCVVDLPAPAPVHIMVRGWDPSSSYTLEAFEGEFVN